MVGVAARPSHRLPRQRHRRQDPSPLTQSPISDQLSYNSMYSIPLCGIFFVFSGFFAGLEWARAALRQLRWQQGGNGGSVAAGHWRRAPRQQGSGNSASAMAARQRRSALQRQRQQSISTASLGHDRGSRHHRRAATARCCGGNENTGINSNGGGTNNQQSTNSSDGNGDGNGDNDSDHHKPRYGLG